MLLLAAGFSLRGFRIDPSLAIKLPENPASRELREADGLFPVERSLVVALPVEDGPVSAKGIARLAEVSGGLRSLGEARGAWTLVSPLTVSDLERVGDAMVEAPLVAGPAEDPLRLHGRLDASLLLKKLFLSAKGSAWTLYLRVHVEREELLAGVDEAKALWPELRFAGQPYYQAMNGRILSREFPLLLAAAALVLLAIELVIMRSLAPAVFLWIFSLLPTFFLIALFSLTGTALRLDLVLAPALTLALTNSYVTHIYRGWAAESFDAMAALRSKGKVVLLDALTTLLGYGGLLVSPLVELRTLGLFCIAGCLISLVVALVSMPAALSLVRSPSRAARRFAASAAVPPVPGPSREGRIGRPGRRLAPLAWSAAALVMGFFALKLEAGISVRDYFVPGSARAAEFSFFDKEYSGLGEATLVVETGREYGLVDLDLFRALRDLERGLAAVPDLGSVYGYTDLVAEASARWDGKPGTVEPATQEEIGEMLELLSGTKGATLSKGVVDADWSAARFTVTLAPGFQPVQDMDRLRAAADAAWRATGCKARLLWGGAAAESAIEEKAYLSGQISGTFLFFAALVLGLVLVLRSFPKALAVSLVPILGFLASLGLMGLLGWRLCSVHALALATIAGTGVDNALALVLGGWSREARDAAVDSSILIVLSVLALCFCSSYYIVQAAIVCSVGLVASALASVILIPALIGDRTPKDPAP